MLIHPEWCYVCRKGITHDKPMRSKITRSQKRWWYNLCSTKQPRNNLLTEHCSFHLLTIFGNRATSMLMSYFIRLIYHWRGPGQKLENSIKPMFWIKNAIHQKSPNSRLNAHCQIIQVSIVFRRIFCSSSKHCWLNAFHDLDLSFGKKGNTNKT